MMQPKNHAPRTQHRAVPQYIPVQPQPPHFQPAPPPPQPQPPHKRKKRARFSLVKTLLMLIGLCTVLVVLARYVIVPVLVMLPAWMGGGV